MARGLGLGQRTPAAFSGLPDDHSQAINAGTQVARLGANQRFEPRHRIREPLVPKDGEPLIGAPGFAPARDDRSIVIHAPASGLTAEVTVQVVKEE